MNAAKTACCRTQTDPEWFIPWFNSIHYHALYAHRDEAEAARFVDELIEYLLPNGGDAVLDLACGTGRHAKRLALRGLRVLGIDLSTESVAEAKRNEGPNLWFRPQDMRLPFGTRVFDYVLNLFTSFGYFEDPAENLTVVHNVAQSLKPGGRFVLDYVNVALAEKHLINEEAIKREGVVYRISRWADANHIFKRISFVDPPGGADGVYRTSPLAAFDVDTSPRLVDRFFRMRLTVSGVIPR
jgi:SAM-dependent methyltransferase